MPAAGAYKREIDLSLYTEVDSDLVVGMVHSFSKGPINEKTLVTNVPDLEARFGDPIDDDTHCQGFFAAREYLRQGNQCFIVRADSAASPAEYGSGGIRGATDETLETGSDGATSIPATKQFTSALSTFIANGVLAGDVLEIQSGADAGWYLIVSVDLETQVTVDRDFPTGSLSALNFTVWTCRRAGGDDGVTSVPAARRFTSTTATFSTNGVQAGDVLYINDTGDDDDNGFYVITSVVNETTVDVNRDFPVGSLTALTYVVYGANHPAGTDGDTSTDGEFVSATALFQDHGVKAGDLLIIEDTTDTGDNGVYVITGLKTGSEDTILEVNYSAWPAGTLTNLSFRVVPGVLKFTGESKGDWCEGWTITTAVNAVVPTTFDVNIYNADGYLVETLTGETLATVVADFLANSVYFPTVSVVATRLGPALNYSGTAGGGTNGTTGLVNADLIGSTGTGLQLFSNVEELEVDLLLIPGYSSGQAVGDALLAMAGETRGDCMAIIDPPNFAAVDTPQEAVDWHNGSGSYGRTTALNSSFGASYWGGWCTIEDTYHGGTREIAPCGPAAAVWAQSENATKAWFAPAGRKRGQLKGVSSLEYSPDAGERAYMTSGGNNLNPLAYFVRKGNYVYGQMTLYRSTSALNRISVRRMMLRLERAALEAIQDLVFDPNDNATDREIVNLLTPLFDEIANNRGMTEYLIVVDDTTSPPAIRQQNKLIGKAYIKPTPTAEVIEMQFILTAQTAEFATLLAA